MSQRTNALAERLDQGARALATFASDLTDAEWQTRVPKDGRKVGVIVHHVASVYPLEIQLAQTLAGGKPVAGVTWDAVHEMNAGHAKEHDAVTKETALELPAQQRGSRGGNPGSRRRRARSGRSGVAQLRCPAHVPVHAGGSRRPA